MTPVSVTPGLVGGARPLAAIALVLSFAAGATDGFAFLLLGGVFTANMTGNLVLAGLVQREDYPSTIVGIAAALAAFVVGVYLALRLTREARRAHLAGALAVGMAAQAAVLVGWLLFPHPLDLVATTTLLVPSAVAMAAQTAVSKRVEVRSGVSTTYVTGTITSIAADLADGRPQDLFTRVGVLVSLVAGALCAGLLMLVAPAAAAALPVAAGGVGLALLLMGLRPAAAGRERPRG